MADALRRAMKAQGTQLPARTDTRIPVPMTEQQRAEHDDLIRPIASLVSKAARRPLMQTEFLVGGQASWEGGVPR